MKTSSSPLLIALTAAIFLAPLPGKAERTPPGAFLRYRVKTSTDASRQVIEDKTVANRYSAFFKTSPGKVADSFADLRLERLSHDWRGRVYFRGRGDRVISEVRTLKAGYWVYVDWKGRPVLDAGCGNPLTTSLPSRPPKELPPPVSSNPLMMVPQGGGPEFAAAAPMPVFTTELAPLTLLPETQVSALAPVVYASRGGFPLPLLIPLLFTGGGGGGGNTPPPPVIDGGGGGGDNPPPVPEPASMVMTAMGLAAAAKMRRRAR